MARVTNTLLQGASGRVGDIILTTRNGKTHMRAAPSRRKNYTPTANEQKVRTNFLTGIIYAKNVMQNAELKKLYEAHDRSGRNAYQLAIRDACRPPIVRNIITEKYHGLPGDEIFIRAVDDFMVKSVLVTIKDSEGNVIEQGEAIETLGGLDWVYEAKVENPSPPGCTIRATAKDMPGNNGSLELII